MIDLSQTCHKSLTSCLVEIGGSAQIAISLGSNSTPLPSQIVSLPQPYGFCETNVVPVSECQMRCQAKHALRMCNCLDVYMATKQHSNGEF